MILWDPTGNSPTEKVTVNWRRNVSLEPVSVSTKVNTQFTARVKVHSSNAR